MVVAGPIISELWLFLCFNRPAGMGLSYSLNRMDWVLDGARIESIVVVGFSLGGESFGTGFFL